MNPSGSRNTGSKTKAVAEKSGYARRRGAAQQHAEPDAQTAALCLLFVRPFSVTVEHLLCEPANFRFGHATEVQGLHRLAAAFENEADRRILFF